MKSYWDACDICALSTFPELLLVLGGLLNADSRVYTFRVFNSVWEVKELGKSIWFRIRRQESKEERRSSEVEFIHLVLELSWWSRIGTVMCHVRLGAEGRAATLGS